MSPTRCVVCGLLTEPDEAAEFRCVASHPVGTCCHAGSWLLCEDGTRQRFVALPACVLVEREPSVTVLPNELSHEAGVCHCDNDDPWCSVRLVERAGATDTVLHCLMCGETRVIHSRVPR